VPRLYILGHWPAPRSEAGGHPTDADLLLKHAQHNTPSGPPPPAHRAATPPPPAGARQQATIDQGYIYAGARRSCLPTSCSGMDQAGWHGELSQLMLACVSFGKCFLLADVVGKGFGGSLSNVDSK